MKGWAGRAVWLMLTALLLTASSALAATSSYVPPIVITSTSAVPATGLPGDQSNVALDACGNIYTVQQYGGQVVEIPYGGGAAKTVVAAGGANYDTAVIWIDGAYANLYVAQGTNGVIQIPITNCVPQVAGQTSVSIPAPLTYYWNAAAIASDSTGDLFFGTNVDCCDAGNELYEVVASGSKYPDGTSKASAHLVGNLSQPVTSIAVDASNNIYYVSGGALYELTPITDGYSSKPVLFGSGYTSVVGVSLDASGNLYVADQGPSGQYAINGYYPPLFLSSVLWEIPYETTTTNGTTSSALNPADQFIVVQGSGTANPLTFANAVAVAPSGNIFFGNNGSSVYELTQFNANIGSATVGSSVSATLSVAFNAAEKPAAIALSSNSAFASTGGTCAAGVSYTAGNSCTITAQFVPAAPGTASSGITLTGSTGAALATAYLQGIGLGAGLTVDTGTISSVGGGFTIPMSVALDAAGNSYFADAGSNAVLEFKSGSTTAISLGAGLNKPSGVAVDGAGNVIIADTGNNQIVEVPVVSGKLSNAAQFVVVASSTSVAGSKLSGPAGVTVDPQGDLYIADTGNNRVVYLPYNGSWNSALASTLGSGLIGPLATAVDASGNLYVANSGSGQIYRLSAPLSSGVQQLVAVGFNKPSALATDASGSLFVVDQGNGNVVRIPSLSGTLNPNAAIEVGIGNANPYGLALDKSGNVYVADSSAAAYLITRTGTTESFGVWAVGSPSGPLPVKVENEGNQALVFASPFDTASGNTGDFSLSAVPASECSNGGSVAVGAGCELDATFQPTASGARSETLVLNSNATNSASAQVILSGTGATEVKTATALAITAPATGTPFFGEPITLTATVTSSSGTPGGTAQLLVDGVITAQATANASGVATFNLATGLTGGSHSLQAIYLGSSSFDGSTSSILSLSVSTAPTTSTLVITAPFINPYSALSSASVTFTVTVNSTGVGIPTGAITFTTGSTSLGSASLAPASGGVFQAAITTTKLPVGTDLVTATYSGDANYVSSSTTGTVTVVSTPSVTIAPSSNTLTSATGNDTSVTITHTSYGGWQGVVGYQCLASSLPVNSICVFSPGQINVMASTSSTTYPPPTTTLTVVVNNPPNSPAQGSMIWWLGGLTGLLLFWTRRRFVRGAWGTITMLIGAALLAISASGLMACNSGVAFKTPAGTSTITVIASSDPFTSGSTSSTQPCGVNSKTNLPDPTLAPCSQQTFQFFLTVQ
jgi:sugar lactone lactonase YvrE